MSDTPELDKMTAALRDAERYRFWRHKLLSEDFDVVTILDEAFDEDSARQYVESEDREAEFDAAVNRAMQKHKAEESRPCAPSPSS